MPVNKFYLNGKVVELVEYEGAQVIDAYYGDDGATLSDSEMDALGIEYADELEQLEAEFAAMDMYDRSKYGGAE